MADTILNAATLIAALASAFFAFFGTRTEGRRRIADMRRFWIEDLRRAISEYTALCFESATNKLGDGEVRRAVELNLYIIMMLNPERGGDNEHITLEASVNRALGQIVARCPVDGEIVQEIVDSARSAFKATWETVKQESKA